MTTRGREWGLAAGAVASITILLLLWRTSLDKTHVALAYLLVVLGVSSRGGHSLGVSVSIVAFLCFNFFFLPPHYTLTVADPLDWAVLAAFLFTSLTAAQLLVRARSEAASAELRATEVERLSALGAETLNAGRTEDALWAVAEVIRTTFDAEGCEIHLREPQQSTTRLVARSGAGSVRPDVGAPGLPSLAGVVDWVAVNGRAAVELSDGTMRVAEAMDTSGVASMQSTSVRLLVLPLRVRERIVGVLTIGRARELRLDRARQKFLEVLSYYAALGVERWMLSRDAERAEALQKADEVKNAVLASVSHDLRTPLTTIKALANQIRQDGDDRAVTIEEEADRLNRFVGDLLDLSQLAAGVIQVRPEINAAEDLVGAAMQRISGVMGDRNLVASLAPSEPLLLGRFDFVHSLRVLGNLIENAIKFAPARSQVEVLARRRNGELEFVVADRGPGVPQMEVETIFEPFYRRATNVPDTAGVGLGLSIARGLAEVQGGRLRYEPRDGGGSVFVFAVPAADVSELTDEPGTPL